MQTMIRRRPTGIAVALLAVLVLAACAGAMGEPLPPAGEARTLEHQGIERHYYIAQHRGHGLCAGPLGCFAPRLPAPGTGVDGA